MPINHTHHKLNKSSGAGRSAQRPVDKPLGEILDDELMREAKHAKKECSEQDDGHIIELTSIPSTGYIRPGMLPPSLRERFPHACVHPHL